MNGMKTLVRRIQQLESIGMPADDTRGEALLALLDSRLKRWGYEPRVPREYPPNRGVDTIVEILNGPLKAYNQSL